MYLLCINLVRRESKGKTDGELPIFVPFNQNNYSFTYLIRDSGYILFE